MKNMASAMCLFSILNSTIEVGERIIKMKNLETPLKYKEIFEILGEEKILSKKVSNELAKLMFIRNMLAHQYGKIQLKRLYEVIKNKTIFIQFIEEIKTKLL